MRRFGAGLLEFGDEDAVAPQLGPGAAGVLRVQVATSLLARDIDSSVAVDGH